MIETITPPPSPSPTRTPTVTQTPTPTPQPTICTPTIPSDWVSYVIQPGDTVAILAALTGAPVEQVIAVNCLPENQRITAGETIYLPQIQPPTTASAPIISTESPTENTVQPTAPATDDHGHDSGEDDSSHSSGESESGG